MNIVLQAIHAALFVLIEDNTGESHTILILLKPCNAQYLATNNSVGGPPMATLRTVAVFVAGATSTQAFVWRLLLTSLCLHSGLPAPSAATVGGTAFTPAGALVASLLRWVNTVREPTNVKIWRLSELEDKHPKVILKQFKTTANSIYSD
ncbi:unnamed protein product [Leptidea sinapis]|uniref:Uncharacterized protein n=1 Tax=Leptidea sinapis TaxID=189913 RepID=A0A5E4Q112_9NEOP|nr:unnamed protein product [Leptidea sinapis]